jgi:signal transduction histidine kinase/CheY-like chemotaxis protein/AraC-like DNA-binding protein
MLSSFLIYLLLMHGITYTEIESSIENISYSSLNKKFTKIIKKRGSHDSVDIIKEINELYFLTKKKQASIAVKTHKENLLLNTLQIDLLLFKMVVFQNTQKNHDSIVQLGNYIKKNTTNNYQLGRSKCLVGYSYYTQSNYIVFVQNFREASQHLNLSKNTKSNVREVKAITGLIEFYLEINSIPHAKTLFAILPYKINQISSKEERKKILNSYKLLKSKLCLSEERYADGIAILNTLDQKELQQSNYELYDYYTTLIEIYLNANMPDKANTYYKKLNTSVNLNFLSIQEKEDAKRIYLTTYYLLQKNTKEAGKNLVHLEEIMLPKNPQNRQILFLLEKYYAEKENYKKAHYYLVKATKTKDSMQTNNLKIISDLALNDLKYDSELVQLNTVNLSKEALIQKNKQLYFMYAIIILLTLVFLYGILYYRNKKKKLKQILALKEAQQILTAKNNMLEIITQEVGTPITNLLGFVSLIKENTFKPLELVKYANNAQKNIDSIVKILNDFSSLLHPKKKHHNNNPFSTKKTKLYIKELLFQHLDSFETKKIKLYFKTNILDETEFTYNYESLKIITSNLISNALKYSEINTAVYVSVVLNEHGLTIVVTDQGIGFDNKKIDFSTFYQSKNHFTDGNFGIGLPLTSELVHSLNGTIVLKSAPKVGSSFTITLPLLITNYSLFVEEKKIEFKCLNKITTTPKVIENNLPNMLIIDDNLNSITFLETIFSPTYNCYSSFNGKEGLEKLKKTSFDVIVSSAHMPIMCGIEFKTALNNIAASKDIPFLLITTKSEAQIKELTFNAGIDAYILRPFTKNEILLKVESISEKNIYSKKVSNLSAVCIEYEGSHSKLMEKINKIILANINNLEFNVTFLSSECGIGQRELNKILKAKTGLTISHIVLEVRLLKAHELILKKTYPTIKEVMFAVGLNSRAYFNKTFLKRFGVKPNDVLK